MSYEEDALRRLEARAEWIEDEVERLPTLAWIVLSDQIWPEMAISTKNDLVGCP